MMIITVIKNKIMLDERFWGKKLNNQDLGDCILNLLFYSNKEGIKEYSLIVNGIDETSDFQSQVKDKYKDILNTELRDNFFKYCNIKN